MLGILLSTVYLFAHGRCLRTSTGKRITPYSKKVGPGSFEERFLGSTIQHKKEGSDDLGETPQKRNRLLGGYLSTITLFSVLVWMNLFCCLIGEYQQQNNVKTCTFDE